MQVQIAVPRRGRSAWRLAGFVSVPLMSAIAPLLVIPSITAEFGALTWASVALAQSVGSGAGVIVELGWGLNGPQRVAKASPLARGRIYALSTVTKVVVALLLTAPTALIAWLLAPSAPGEAAIISVSFLLAGLAPVWYFIGEGRPLRILLFDASPRLAGAVISAIAMSWLGAPLLFYALTNLFFAAMPPIFGWIASHARTRPLQGYGWRRIARVIRAQGAALGGRAASALYIALPTTLVGIAAPSALVLFSSIERLTRLALAVLQAFPNSLQAWVGRIPSTLVAERRRRVRIALGLNSGLGIVSAVGFTVTAPLLAQFLFSGTVSIPTQIAALAGCVVLITCISRATGGLGLVAYGRIHLLAISAVAGASIGVPAILLLAKQFGAAGAIAGEIVAELSVLGIQFAGLLSVGIFSRKRRGRES